MMPITTAAKAKRIASTPMMMSVGGSGESVFSVGYSSWTGAVIFMMSFEGKVDLAVFYLQRSYDEDSTSRT